MPQYLQERNSDWPRTLHGFGRRDESPQADGSWESSRFVPIGARVGRSGQVFETEAAGGAGPLVVKLFTWGAGLPEAVVQDFTREAMTVANLRHPHVARVVDAGTLGDGTPFVVMERLAGMTLDEMAGGGGLSIAEVVAIVRGVGSALFAAHEAGVAHGAVRADNVFVAEPAGHGLACPKLMDFGVARLAGAARALGRFVDEPGAPAPTHAELGRRAGERADQLALATLAWRLLGGTAAPAVERVLFRAMSPDPSARFGAVTAFVAALQEASVQASVQATVNAPVAAVTVVRPRAVAPAIAPPAAPAGPPSSLTQQFFAEGEQLEMVHAAGRAGAAAAAADEGAREDEEELEIAPARVPRSRAQMAVAALLALTSVTIIAGTVVSLADKPASGPVAAETTRAVAGGPPASRLSAVSPAPPAASHARRKAAMARGVSAGPVRPAAPAAASPPAADLGSPPNRPAPVAVVAPVAAPPAAIPAPAAPPAATAAPPAAVAGPAEAAPPPADNAAPSPGAAPAAASDEGETEPADQTADPPPAAAPAPIAPPAEAPPAPPAAP